MNEIRQTFDEEQYQAIHQHKIFSAGQIRFTGLLGGPLVAAYFLSENFKVFDDRQNIAKTWLGASAILVLCVILNCLYPSMHKVIPFTIPMMIILIINKYIRAFQEKSIQAHLKKGGAFYPWGRALGIIVAGTVITIIISIILHAMLHPFLPNLELRRANG